jgi:hypothetical protein
VLRACARLLRPGGRTAFYTIHPAPGLTPAQRRRASRDGPIAVATPREYDEMLAAAGFVDVVQRDATAEFVTAARAWIDQSDWHRDALVAQSGQEAFDDRQRERRAQLRAVEDGLLRRSLFAATRPARRRGTT